MNLSAIYETRIRFDLSIVRNIFPVTSLSSKAFPVANILIVRDSLFIRRTTDLKVTIIVTLYLVSFTTSFTLTIYWTYYYVHRCFARCEDVGDRGRFEESKLQCNRKEKCKQCWNLRRFDSKILKQVRPNIT